ncbi:MAG TPA: hypothetical protein PLP42_14930 [Acidobacteriota bacterium]|nr:hypothetical protein [Acidobacteriota bacterium]
MSRTQTEELKTFIRTTARFAVFTACFYFIGLVLGALLFPSLMKNVNFALGSPGHLHTRLREVKSYGAVDVLFIGSSHAYRGFDPRIFSQIGLKSFVLGSSAQTPIQTEILVDRYLDSLKPKTVVFEVHPGILQADGVESGLDLIANDEIDIRTIKMALQLKNIRIFNTLLYGLFRNALSLDDDFREKERRGTDQYIPGGFVERVASDYRDPELPKQREWKPVSYQIEAFERVLRRLTDRQIAVILVWAPVSAPYYHSYSNNEVMDAYFQSLYARSLCDAYYNFNQLLALQDRMHFYDGHHLNQAGVEVFNRHLARLLTDKPEFLQLGRR